jgi:repressor LexA|tara:strand:- start:998 stop:1228 length:231 start_codon:yes stop_codon:yes gene_type:complete
MTPKQRLVYEFIWNFWVEHAYSPTYDDVRNHFGFKSDNSVVNYYQALEKKGYIKNCGTRGVIPVDMAFILSFLTTF